MRKSTNPLIWSGAIFVFGCVVAAYVTYRVAGFQQTERQERFDILAERATSQLARRIQVYEYGLRGTRGAVIAAGIDTTSRHAFLRYSESRDLAREFPGSRGFGFIRRVSRGDEAAFSRAERTDGMPDFKLRELEPHDGDRLVIQYIEPAATNRQAIGLDIASEPNRRQAALEALRDDRPTLTHPITLVQASGKVDQGFLFFLPVYRAGAKLDTPENRLNAAAGLAYTPLVIDDVLADFDLFKRELSLTLYDADQAGAPKRFYASALADAPLVAGLVKRLPLTLYGRNWLVEFKATPNFVSDLHLRPPRQVAAQVVAVSALLAVLSYLLLLNAQHRRQSALGDARLAAIVDGASDGIIGKDLQGVVTSWNRTAEQIFGYSAEQAVGKTLASLIVPADRLHEEDSILESIKRGESVPQFTTQRRRRDGSLIDVAVTVSPIRDGAGEVVGSAKTVRDITEQRLAEERFRLAVEAAPTAMLMVDGARTVILASRKAEELFGYSSVELLGMRLENLIPKRYRDSHEQNVRHYFDAPHARPMGTDRELYGLHKSGREIPVEIGLNPVETRAGTATLASITDITHRRQLERQLQATLQRQKLAVDAAGLGIWVWRLADNQLVWDDRMYAIYGIPAALRRSTIPYDFWRARVHPDDIATTEEQLQRHLRGENVLDTAFRVVLDSGEVRYVQAAAIVERAPDGRPIQMVGINRDITEQKTAEGRILELNANLEAQVAQRTAQLATNERFLHSVIDAMPGLVGYWDANLRCRFANRAYQDWFGRTKEEMVGISSQELLGEELFRKNEPYIRGALRGEAQLMERTITKPDGSTLHTLAHFLPDIEGDVVRGYIVVSTDVTMIKQAEDALLEAKRKAEDATQAKSAFLANMSHEIRTPMNAILGLCYLLEKQELSAVTREMVQKIHGAGRSLLGIINDILDFSKIEARRLDIEDVPFRLSDVLDNLASIMGSSLGSKPVELVVASAPVGADYLRGDSLRLGQVLVNLASNAIKFTEQGEVAVRVDWVGSDAADRVMLRFSVRDTGIGIPKEKQQLIFQAFSQADSSTTRSFGGTGLGLTISGRLVELMGGQLSVESEPGRGSEFSFVLPFERSDPMDASLPEMAHLRVLVADDHVTARAVLADTVGSLGWHADAVESGAQAIARASEPSAPSYDILLLDWRMPGVDGLQAAAQIHQLRSQEKAPIIVMVSAYDREQLRERVGSEVADVILNKPVTSSALYNAVLEAKRHRGELQTAALAPSSLRRLQGVRLLVVDDSEINRDVAEHILTGEGASVELAADGRAALAMLESRPEAFDVVLMDMQMPVMDGYAATRQVRAMPALAHLPVIALTAGAFKSQRDLALEAGVDDFVAKPFEVDQLVGAIVQLAQRQGQGAASTSSMTPQARAEMEDELAVAAPLVLNVERGLRVWSEPAAFGRSLHKFLASHGDTGTHIMAASPDVAASLAHKLKGTAAQLGLEVVASLAAQAERGLKMGEDVRETLMKLQEAMTAAKAAIEAYAPPSPAASTLPAATAAATATDPSVLAPELAHLLRVLDSDDASRVEPVLDTLAALLPPEHLQPLRSAVANYDFRGAEAVARQLAEAFKLELED